MGDIKIKVKDFLQELVSDQILREVYILKPKDSVFKINLDNFPVAVIAAPYMENSRLTNQDNERIYNFEIIVLDKTEHADSDDYVENLASAIVEKFEDNENNTLWLAVEPSTIPVEPIATADTNLFAFGVLLKIRAIETI